MAKVGKEIRKMKAEPLLPVEKSLVIWSLVLGAALMVVLLLISQRFFPGAA